MASKRLGILGATSFVGERILALLKDSEWQVCAYSRQLQDKVLPGVHWRSLSEDHTTESIQYWICVAPIWFLPEYFPFIEKSYVRRILALSTTSRFTKNLSSDPNEVALVKKLIQAEAALQSWAETNNIEWIILRPTLIYGYGRDKNISEIARFIKRFRFFPVFGQAHGLRQPVHADDVAQACLQALHAENIKNKAYNISGAETLSYRDMVRRIFSALNQKQIIVTVPIFIFRIGIACLRVFPRFKNWTTEMVQRMNQNLTFDHSNADNDFEFKPRCFLLTASDLPDANDNK